MLMELTHTLRVTKGNNNSNIYSNDDDDGNEQ